MRLGRLPADRCRWVVVGRVEVEGGSASQAGKRVCTDAGCMGRLTHLHARTRAHQPTNANQVLFGIAGGMLAGAVLGCTRIWNNKYKRLMGIFGSALLLMFFLEHFDMLSGGALGALFTGLTACAMWEKGWPKRWSAGASASHAPDVERVMAKVWCWVFIFGGGCRVESWIRGRAVFKCLLVLAAKCTARAAEQYRMQHTFLLHPPPSASGLELGDGAAALWHYWYLHRLCQAASRHDTQVHLHRVDW